MHWYFRSLFLFALWLGWNLPLQAQADFQKEIRALQTQVHQLIEKTEPSIACIAVSRTGKTPSAEEPWKLGAVERVNDPNRQRTNPPEDLHNPNTIPDSYGSGVVVDGKAGLILTNFHVIKDATKVYVRLPNGIGSYANIHAADGRSDLAVLKLVDPVHNLKEVRFGDGSKIRKGDFVISMANPFAVGFRDGSPSASWGMISNLRRRSPGPVNEYERVKKPLNQYQILVQTDARLNLGCSGGALFNLDGEMIALTTSIAAIQGGEGAGGFAIPMDPNIQRLIATLKRGEEVDFGFLGVMLTSDIESHRGIHIRSVNPGLPAAKAGLVSGDTIVSINGIPLREYDDLFLTVGAQLAGTEITLEVQSALGSRTRKVTLKLAKATGQGLISIASRRREFVFGMRIDYTSVLMQNDEIPLPTGVLIRDIQKGSLAEERLKPKREGDRMVITHVNGKEISSPEEFYQAVKDKGSLELKVVDVVRNPFSTERIIKLP
jgi:serine protease Do